MIKDNRNNEQIYGRNDMVMLNPNNKIYGSLGIADKYVMKTEEGTRLILNNPKLGKFGDVLTEFNIYGRSEQKRYNGYQLLPLAPINRATGEKLNLPHTENGITVDIANDGIGYTIRGTNTLDGQQSDIHLSITNEFDIEAGTYTRSGKIINGNNGVEIISGGGLKNGGVLEYKAYKSDFTFTETVEKGKSGNFIIRISKNATVNATVYFQIEKGSVAHDYEPYVGGKPSPSPEYPQEIKSVGDNGSVVVNVTGANVLEGTKLGVKTTVSGITYTTYENGVLVTGTAANISSMSLHEDMTHRLTRGTYYLTTKGLSPSVTLNFFFVGIFSSDIQNKEITLTRNVDYSLMLQILKGATVNTTVQVSLTKSKITSYEPYQEEQTVAFPYILNAIPVSSGGNYIDQSGQQYIADRVVEKDGVFGIERNTATDVPVLTKELRETPDVKGRFIQDGAFKKTFTFNAPLVNIGYGTNWGVAGNVIDKWIFGVSKKTLYISPPKNLNYTSEDIFNALKDLNIKVYGALLVPFFEPLPVDIQAKLRTLVTYYPVTIIENNYNAWMKATYKSTESV